MGIINSHKLSNEVHQGLDVKYGPHFGEGVQEIVVDSIRAIIKNTGVVSTPFV
jgi:hypothetical protein